MIVSYGYSFCCYAVAMVVVVCQTIVVASYLSSYFCYALVVAVAVAVILSANGYYLHSLGAIIKTDLRNANPFFFNDIHSYSRDCKAYHTHNCYSSAYLHYHR